MLRKCGFQSLFQFLQALLIAWIRHAREAACKQSEPSAISLWIVSMEMASFKHVDPERYFTVLWKYVFTLGSATTVVWKWPMLNQQHAQLQQPEEQQQDQQLKPLQRRQLSKPRPLEQQNVPQPPPRRPPRRPPQRPAPRPPPRPPPLLQLQQHRQLLKLPLQKQENERAKNRPCFKNWR